MCGKSTLCLISIILSFVSTPSSVSAEELPAIEAKTYPVTVRKRSRSLRVYLFSDPTQGQPPANKIFLAREGDQNVMAFRSIKLYPDKREFAAARVRNYDDDRKVLELNENFTAVQKIRDLYTYTPSAEENRLDLEDLKEIESGKEAPLPQTRAYDPDLDAGTTPPPEPYEGDEPELDEELDDLEKLMIDDVEPFDRYRHWLSAQTGYIRNLDTDGASIQNFTGGLRYGFTLKDLIFLETIKAQDSVVLEAGVYLYRILGYTGTTDSYTIMPLIGTLRYNIWFSSDFGLFGYGGLVKNVVVSASQASDAAIVQLGSILPAAGVGIFYRLGPKWYLRVDFGIDVINGGLVLHF